MIILPYVKLGTMPFGPARVKSKRTFPEIGDTFFIREAYGDKDIYSNPWREVRLESINEETCWFVSRI